MKYSSLYIAVVVGLTAGYAAAVENSNAKTRDQVKAELADAVRTGDIVLSGRSGLKANELTPHLYPSKATEPGKTREEVKAELAEYMRAGEFKLSGRSSLTANQVTPDLYPAKPIQEGKTRAQVREELAEAVKAGTVLTGRRGESRVMLP